MSRRRLTLFLDGLLKDNVEDIPEQHLVDILQKENFVPNSPPSSLTADVTKMRKGELYVPVSIINQWERISEEVKSFTQVAMETSLKDVQALDGSTEKAIREVMSIVESRLATAVAPVNFRHENYTELNKIIKRKTS